ncbi:MAG: quinoprotein dehydrogenase-associated putative ABC transporter substrate-binding protein [Methylophilaceae bacterium]
MFKTIIKTMFMLFISTAVIAADDIPVNIDEGKIGGVRRVPKADEFKVCADQDNLPYSNAQGEGFENKIAEILAADLGRELTYQFWHDRFGFLRNTLNGYRCDYVIGTNTTYDALDTTKPYYRAGHVWVYRKDSGFDIKNWDSPDLRKGTIGVNDKSPVAVALNANGLMFNAKPYRIQRDLNTSPGQKIEDLAKGDIDIAIEWGPIGGYYAKKSDVEMVVVPIPEYATDQTRLTGKTYWNISGGVRKREADRRDELEAAIFRNLDKIHAVMDEFGIPWSEPTFEDRLDGYKRHKN